MAKLITAECLTKLITLYKSLDDNERIKLGKEAQKEWFEVVGKINKTRTREKKDLQCIETFIENVANGQNLRPLKMLDVAKGAFEKHVSPFLDEEKRIAEKTVSNDIHPKTFTERSTDTFTQTSKGIAERYQSIRHSDDISSQWDNAYDELKARYTDKDIEGILLGILQKAYLKCRKEADRTLNALITSEKEIIQGSRAGSKGNIIQEENGAALALLKQYIHVHAKYAVPRMQKTFLKTKLMKGYTAESFSHLTVFAQDCVEVCWYMAVEDPPIVLDTTGPGSPFETALYDFYIKKGSKIDQIVWPALRIFKSGLILAKGVASGK
ncbi:uncharacterized protein LOC128228912 [Mya arenaria]|uniref:uncharacterized protein LOC128228912 n=1 Tax=Mya arenaria TaxID=6604 RepID=UPI0022E45412|nr:uncharacterized protein LOC128228912 [Mya arenaria]